MRKMAPQLQDINPVAAIASAAIQCARTLETTGIAAGTWFGYCPFARTADDSQGVYDPGQLAAFQAAIKRDAARLTASLIRPSHGYLKTLLRCAEQACLAPEEIGKILRYMTSLYGQQSASGPDLTPALERQKFRAGEARAIRESVCLVTLGLHCMPWVMLNRWGLRSESDFNPDGEAKPSKCFASSG